MSFRLQNFWSFGGSWKKLDEEFGDAYMTELDEFLCSQPANGFYPAGDDIFRALEETRLDTVKVVILGQDPYFREGQATGLAFAVPKSEELPPSLRNIYRELQANGYPRPSSGDLTPWAKQGVLLLNCILTVQAGKPRSHRRKGWWTRFTERVIELVTSENSGVVFCLWGREAQRKEGLIVGTDHHVLKASHPSPRTAHRALQDCPSFLGCQHFSAVNRLLEAEGHKPIRW